MSKKSRKIKRPLKVTPEYLERKRLEKRRANKLRKARKIKKMMREE